MGMRMRRQDLVRFFGFEPVNTSHAEKILSALGGLCAMAVVLLINHDSRASDALSFLLPSIGASAVLVFALPHAPLSQPWPVFGGHVVSSLIGIACLELAPGPVLAAVLALALSIAAMYYLHCIHPPGGATAMALVVAGPVAAEYGIVPVLMTVVIDVVAILLIAILFNLPFKWRRYPAALMPVAVVDRDRSDDSLSRRDLEYALARLNVLPDISEEALQQIYELARSRAASGSAFSNGIQPGHCYSAGSESGGWRLRRVEDVVDDETGERRVSFTEFDDDVTGPPQIVPYESFAAWARYEVRPRRESAPSR